MRAVLLTIVLLFANRVSASDQLLVQLGEEVDYVGSAIALLPDTRVVSGVTSHATGSRFGEDERELFGWYVRVVDSSRNAMVPSWLSLRLIQLLEKLEWTVAASPIAPTGNGSPVSFLGKAEKGETRITFLVTIFTAEDGVVRISYSQRRSVIKNVGKAAG